MTEKIVFWTLLVKYQNFEILSLVVVFMYKFSQNLSKIQTTTKLVNSILSIISIISTFRETRRYFGVILKKSFLPTLSHFSLRLAGIFGRLSGFAWELSLATVSFTFRKPETVPFSLKVFSEIRRYQYSLVFFDLSLL